MKTRSTTILTVRHAGKVAIGGDGQVTLGTAIMKGDAVKIRRLMEGKVITGFAGAAADALEKAGLKVLRLDLKAEISYDLTNLAGPNAKDPTDKAGLKARNEWGWFGEVIEDVLDKRYKKWSEENKTGSFTNKGELLCTKGAAPGLACVGFMNYVSAMFLEGTYEAQVKKNKERGIDVEPKTMFEDRGIATKPS